jgi:hypothetical protein
MNNNSPNTSVKEALHLFHQDGALDVIAGATLLNFGFDVLGGAETTSLFTWIPILLYSSLKNKNTLPKLTPYLKNVSDKQLRLWTVIPSVGLVLLLVLLGIIMLGDGLNLGDLRSMAGFAFVALACLVPALWVGLRHYFIYAAAAFAAGILSYLLIPPAWSVFIIAACMLFFGGRMMVRFTRHYPLPEEKKDDED